MAMITRIKLELLLPKNKKKSFYLFFISINYIKWVIS